MNALKLAFEQHLQRGVVWLSKKVKIVEMPDERVEGGYGEVQCIRISKMVGIPSYIDFATKKSKAETPLLQRHIQCIEACVNPIQHLGMIKFWAVHHKTMESYILWWNGGLLASFLQSFKSKVSEATPNNCIGCDLLPEELNKVMLYQRNCAKLALLLLVIVEKCHAHGLYHNHLSPSNILLHFPPMNKTKIFLRVCDWGMACCISEEVASNYGFQASDEMERQQQLRQHIVPKLFYVFGPRGSETCLEKKKEKHLYSNVGDVYAARILAKMI